MAQIVECVPNFSEGRRRAVVDALCDVVARVSGAALLDAQMDGDHNRSVLTLAGGLAAIEEAAFGLVARASELIDLNHHRGQHPRLGAADVVPLVPIAGLGLDECAAAARRVGARIGRELGIPVYLYDAAASRPDRRRLADVRRGGFERLREQIGRERERAPDYGPARVHATAGATAVGARKLLVAFNANLATSDLEAARAIAHALRERDGGLPHVRALGFLVEAGRRAQVSMNLVDSDATPLHVVLARLRDEAARRGIGIHNYEVVGLISEQALKGARDDELAREIIARDQVLETRLRRALPDAIRSSDR